MDIKCLTAENRKTAYECSKQINSHSTITWRETDKQAFLYRIQ